MTLEHHAAIFDEWGRARGTVKTGETAVPPAESFKMPRIEVKEFGIAIPSYRWDFDPPDGSYKNQALSDRVWDHISDSLRYWQQQELDRQAHHALHHVAHGKKVEGCTLCFPPPPADPWKEWIILGPVARKVVPWWQETRVKLARWIGGEPLEDHYADMWSDY